MMGVTGVSACGTSDGDSPAGIAEGKAALIAGDCETAAGAFGRSSSPEGRVGEAVARSMCLAQHEFVDSVLSDLRQGGFRSPDFFGPDGAFARAERDDEFTGLHPFLDDPDRIAEAFASLGDEITVEGWLDRAGGFLDELREISRLFEEGGRGEGVVFQFPKRSVGLAGQIDVAASDALFAAAAFAVTESGLRLARSFGADIRINRFCADEECSLDDAAARALTRELNTGLGASDDDLSPARSRMNDAFTLVLRGIEAASGSGLIVRTRGTEPALDYLEDLVRAAQTSLADGATEAPGINPVFTFDLREAFTNPPDPSGASVDPFVGELEFVETWAEEMIAPLSNIDLDTSYDVVEDERVGDGLDAWGEHLETIDE